MSSQPHKSESSRSRAAICGGAVAMGLLVGCTQDPINQWKHAAGTKGFINMDAVREAFQNKRTMRDFEKRVNEIYEGDHLIIFEITRKGRKFLVAAREDLNGDKKVSKGDDLVFTVLKSGKTLTLRGHGVNGYYKESWRYDRNNRGALTDQGYLDTGYGAGGFHRHYYTPVGYYDDMWGYRRGYRASTGFRTQINSNNLYETHASKKYGTAFRQSTKSMSSDRARHIVNRSKDSKFSKSLKSDQAHSGWGQRAHMAKKGTLKGNSKFSAPKSSSRSRSSFGGFRGSSGAAV